MNPEKKQPNRRYSDKADERIIHERRITERENLAKVTTLYSGDYYVTDKPNEMIVTILGSCVAACLHDPVAMVGGMNHFLLPDNTASIAVSGGSNSVDSTRYGAFAMEQLINGILQRGGLKKRLEVKVFGGANVINNSSMIGSKNVAFIRNFLKQEGLKITNSDLGGDYPRRLRFYPDTGKAMLMKLARKEDMVVVDEENTFAEKLKAKPIEGDIELF